jgi:hypothetical protein
MQALFLGGPGPFAARALWSWLEGGNGVTEFWHARTTSPGSWRRDRRLGLLRPGWSVSAALARYAIPRRSVGPLRKSPALVQRAIRQPAEVLVSACFTYIVGPDVLGRYGPRAVNLHPGILPAYRGPAPVMTALVRGDSAAGLGVTLHVMSAGVDEGDIIGQEVVPWPAGGWFRQWEIALSRACGCLVRDQLPRYLEGAIRARPQLAPVVADAYRDAEGLVLGCDHSALRMRMLLDTIGTCRPLFVESGSRRIAVRGFDRVIGPPSGGPPRTTPLHVAADAADARVRLHRWMPWTGRVLRARGLLQYARTPPTAAEGPATSWQKRAFAA